jgi:tRNA(Arg) A34 adenosine deaminase TadA
MRKKTLYKIHAACFNRGNQMIATAVNNYSKSHPLQAHFARKVGLPNKINLHAEIAAILKCKTKQIHTIWVTRYNKDQYLRNAKPCPICMAAIKAFGIRNVIYSNARGEMVHEEY